MSKTTDWLPASRGAQLEMARTWLSVLAVKAAAWHVPDADKDELADLAEDAEAALTKAKNETTRTPVATALCRTAFEALVAKMRDMKKRYFLTPPLEEADYVSLGLRIPDKTPSAGKVPSSQVQIEDFLIGRHELGIKIIYVTGNPNDLENKGYRIWYSVVAQGETLPTDPEELHTSFYTQRRRDVVKFDYGASGKTAVFAVQVENDGKKGDWGPMTNALIP
jgi:hypothetical protein